MNKLSATLAAAAVLASGVSAGAASLDYVGPKYGGYQTVNTNLANNVSAGEFHMRNLDTNEDVFAYCVDLFDDLYQGVAQYDVGSLGATVVNGLQGLFTNHYEQVTNRTTSAAFQLSVWEILYEGETPVAYDLTNGAFRSSSGTNNNAWSIAQGWLGDLAYTRAAYRLSFWDGSTDDGRDDRVSQDLVSAELAPVPVPASALLILSGIGAFGALRRRSRT